MMGIGQQESKFCVQILMMQKKSEKVSEQSVGEVCSQEEFAKVFIRVL